MDNDYGDGAADNEAPSHGAGSNEHGGPSDATPPPATPWPQTPAPEVNAPGDSTPDDTPATHASPWAMESAGDLPPTTEIPIGTAGSVPPPPDQAPSWAWSTEAPGAAQSNVPPTGAADTPYGAPYGGSPYGSSVPPAAGAAVATSVTREKRGGVRSAIVGGIAGAVVGALIAGGIVAAVDDNPKQTPVQTVTNTTQEAARPASQSIQPGNIKSILNAARPAVVRIDVGNSPDQPEATGTGFIIDSSGVIVTNAHVVDGFNDVTVHLANGDEATGKVVGADASLDLAVVKINKTGLPTLQLGDSDSLQVGDGVVAIGNALGLSEGSGATVTTGIISGLDRVVQVSQTETLFNALQTDAAINPGNSGGPLLDLNGKVIGINTAIASPDTSNNVGFAISISSAKPVIDALRAGQTPQVAFLGVASEPLTSQAANAAGVTQGAVVADVTSGSGAAKAGIKDGDVIVSIDGNKVHQVEDVASNVRKHRPGDTISIVVVRDGKRKTVSVTLGERPKNN